MPFPRRLTLGLGAWLLFTVFSVEVWYRMHETGETLHWSFEAPTSKENFTNLSLPTLSETKDEGLPGRRATGAAGRRYSSSGPPVRLARGFSLDFIVRRIAYRRLVLNFKRIEA